MTARSRWQWLADLVVHAADHSASAHPSEPSPVRPALLDALMRLGFDDDAIERGLAVALDTTPDDLRRPSAAAVGQLHPERLSVVLCALLEQRSTHLRGIAERWLQCPAVAYQLPPTTLEHWLAQDTRACTLLRGRLPREGLAWLGPDPLRRLARSAANLDTRRAAAQWLARFA